ncbi:FecR domain-containing protein [Pseudomonas sp. RIT-PI-S]|uniref:FecR family protein n=1 Tax=Pseudomonas sp. RIT-PI-S TaxID=3035295 RepID=UPI0021D9452A|nr:FecR domain-containing protein [Pseudomonas sp. RIT-PI-S]
MTDHDTLRAPSAAALDQAMDWLIVLQSPTPAQCQQFDAWLAQDPSHANAYAKVSALWHSDAVGEAARVIDREGSRKHRGHRASYLKLLTLAATLVLAVLLTTNLPLRLKADYITLSGERHRLELQDGSRVLLNTESALSSRQQDGVQTAKLYQGEAWFEVPDHSLPLELQAGPLQASARSGAFAVRYLDGQAQVRVARGDLDLHNDLNQRRRLSAGDAVAVGPAGFGPTTRLNAEEDLSWVDGRLIFENRPLKQVLAELSRYYPGWIVNTNAQLGDIAVTGNYKLNDPIAVIRALARITQAQLREFPALVILD